MKHIIAAVLLCITASSGIFAQVSKGSLFIGPSLTTTTYNAVNNDYNYADSGLRKTTNHNFGIGASPQIGIFVTNHLVVGGSLGFNLTSNKQSINSSEGNVISSDTKRNTFTIDAGPFARYYFFNGTPGKNLFFTQLDARVGTGSGKTTGSGDNVINSYISSGKTSNIFTWDAGGSVGLTHLIQKNIGLDIYAGYDYGIDKSHVLNTTNNTVKGTGVSSVSDSQYDLTAHNNDFKFGVGFHWFLASHKS